MLRQSLQCLNKNSLNVLIRECSTANQKWDLLAAVCIERRPTITPLLNDLQKNFKKYLAEVEYERSHKSDHEIRHELDLKQAELLKKGDADLDLAMKQTAQDFVDVSKEELNQFRAADRTTEADLKKDTKSLNRKLDKHLVLLTKQKLGNTNHYILPQSIRKDGESMREVADRVVKDTFGDNFKVQIYGNAPSGVYKYKYPINIREKNGSVGAKVFFYFGRYTGGIIPENISDYKWLDRMELKKELHPDYHESIAQFLIDENQ